MVVVAPSAALVQRVRAALATHPSVREITMFGGLAFMVSEKMVVCARGDGDLLVRSDPARADELLRREGAGPAEMGAGRPMSKSWISVGPEAIATDDGLTFWIGVALEHHRRGIAPVTG